MVERWKHSGLTAEQHASELEVNATTLQFWKYKLAKPEPSAQRARRCPRVEAALPLLEVRPASAGGGAFEWELSGGKRLRIRGASSA